MLAERFRKIDLAVASQVLWAGIHGVTSLLITVGEDEFPWVERNQLIDETIETLVRGLKQ